MAAITKPQMIQRILDFYSNEYLASLLKVEDADASLKDILRGLAPRRLLRLVIPTLTDQEVQNLPDVQSNRLARPIRSDWEAAALGLPTEIERERGAVKQAQAENEGAPSAEDVAKLYQAPTITPVFDHTGSFVESVIIKKWVVGPDGRPMETELGKDEIIG